MWIKEGDGNFVINRREIWEYFQRLSYREKLVEPFIVTQSVGKFDVWCTVKGGGTTGASRSHGVVISGSSSGVAADDAVCVGCGMDGRPSGRHLAGNQPCT